MFDKVTKIPKTQQERIMSMIQSRYPGYHPLMSIAEIANHPDSDLRTQLACHQTIVKYVESELKSLEVKAEISEEKVIRVSLFEGECEVISDVQSLKHPSSLEPIKADSLIGLFDD